MEPDGDSQRQVSPQAVARSATRSASQGCRPAPEGQPPHGPQGLPPACHGGRGRSPRRTGIRAMCRRPDLRRVATPRSSGTAHPARIRAARPRPVVLSLERRLRSVAAVSIDGPRIAPRSRFTQVPKRLASSHTIQAPFLLEAGPTASATPPSEPASRLLGQDNPAAAGGPLGPFRSQGVPTVGCASQPRAVPLSRNPPPSGVPLNATLSGWRCGGLGGSVPRVPGSRARCGAEGVPPRRVLRGHPSGRSNPPAPAVESPNH